MVWRSAGDHSRSCGRSKRRAFRRCFCLEEVFYRNTDEHTAPRNVRAARVFYGVRAGHVAGDMDIQTEQRGNVQRAGSKRLPGIFSTHRPLVGHRCDDRRIPYRTNQIMTSKKKRPEDRKMLVP